jgi:glyoxylate reductase
MSDRPIVYLVRSIPGTAFERIADRFDVRGGPPHPERKSVQLAQGGDAQIWVPTILDVVDEDLLSQLPRLKHVASYGVGTDHLDLAALKRLGIAVSNTPGVLTEACADMTFALLLASARRVCEGDRFVRSGRWNDQDMSRLLGSEVHGKTLGIVGFGRIGQAVARRAAAFAMPVLYSSPRETTAAGARRVPLDELLATSDFVSLHCPLTSQTRGLMSRERIRHMKKGAILVNTARGAVVDEAALAEALQDGHLGGAALDVFEEEPRVPEHLKRLENVVLTPHLGSGSRDTREAMAAMVVDDIERVASGLAPLHPVLV